MAKKKDQITKRLAALSSKEPVVINAPEIPKKSKRPERAERESVFRAAKLYTRKDTFYSCVVRDISVSGARIAMESVFELPQIVILRIGQLGMTKKCRVIWQDETETGLEFLEDVKTERKEGTLLRRPIKSPE